MNRIIFLAAALALSGCATESFTEGTVATYDYLASGHVGEAKSWVYAQRTIFQGKPGANYTFSRPNGEHIGATRIDSYYRLDSLEHDFVAAEGSHTMRFVLSPATWTFSRTGAKYEGRYISQGTQ